LPRADATDVAVVLYPADLESDVVLRDGLTVRLRPIRDDDAERVFTMLGELSERSVYCRFMGLPHLDLALARKITTVDYDTEMVLVAERSGRLCGLAGYYRDAANRERAGCSSGLPRSAATAVSACSTRTCSATTSR
jgi:hypothetical protein